jgi:hypothetical protein
MCVADLSSQGSAAFPARGFALLAFSKLCIAADREMKVVTTHQKGKSMNPDAL